MPAIDIPEVIKLLREFGQRVALRGGNPYRAKAYARAAESLGTLTVPLAQVIREGRLREIPGVGEAIADIITRLHRTGSHPGLDAMREEIPAGVLEMLSVPGLRPEKVMKLHKELGITSLRHSRKRPAPIASRASRGWDRLCRPRWRCRASPGGLARGTPWSAAERCEAARRHQGAR